MAATGPKSRRLRCCPLPPGVFSTLAFELALPYAGEQALQVTAIWLACALTLLLFPAFMGAR